jgi:Lrp/AsnC family transcriptional regulator for asnA, asnC and gidA
MARRIIAELRVDGRRSYAGIAKSVGLSEAAVRQRIQRLLDTGAMRIVAVPDPRALGLSRRATIGVHAHGDVRAVADRLARRDEVDDVVLTAGSFDLLVTVSARDDDDLLRVLDEVVRTVDGVRDIQTFLHLRRAVPTDR